MNGEDVGAFKKALRQEMMKKRQAHLSERPSRSERIIKHIVLSSIWQTSRVVALFYPMPEEVDVSPLLTGAVLRSDTSHDSDKPLILLPKIKTRDTALDFYPYHAQTALKRHRFGLLEPNPEPDAAPYPLHNVDLVLVPLLAVDCHGTRLGYGGGYYDRTLPRMKRAFRLGVAFHYQLVPDLPRAPWDIPLQAVVTDDGWFEIPC